MQGAQPDLVTTLDPPPAPAAGWAGRVRALAFWAFTLIIALEMAAGALWDLLRIELVRGVFAHLVAFVVLALLTLPKGPPPP